MFTIDSKMVINRIEEKRKEQGISVAELARRIEVDRKRLWYVLNNQREIYVEEFIKLCIFFNLEIKDYINLHSQKNNSTKTTNFDA